MLKDEQNCSHNGGGDANPLKTWSDFSSIQYKNDKKSHLKKGTDFDASTAVLK